MKRDIPFFIMIATLICFVVVLGMCVYKPTPIAIACTAGIGMLWIVDVINCFLTRERNRNEQARK